MKTYVYTLLKFSYRGEGEDDCILPGLHCGTATNLDTLLDLIEKYMTMTNVKSVWLPTDVNDEHIFYVNYNDEFEVGFHHGFKVQAMDTSTAKLGFVTKATDEEAYTAIQRLVTELHQMVK